MTGPLSTPPRVAGDAEGWVYDHAHSVDVIALAPGLIWRIGMVLGLGGDGLWHWCPATGADGRTVAAAVLLDGGDGRGGVMRRRAVTRNATIKPDALLWHPSLDAAGELLRCRQLLGRQIVTIRGLAPLPIPPPVVAGRRIDDAGLIDDPGRLDQ